MRYTVMQCDSADSLAHVLTASFEQIAAPKRHFILALPGGKTVTVLYDFWARKAPSFLPKTTLCLADERCVASDSPLSNGRLIETRFLQHCSVAPRAFIRIDGAQDAQAAADAVNKQCSPLHADAVVLSMGPDGHIASLFPGKIARSRRAYCAVDAPAHLEPHVARVSLTLHALQRAGHVAVIVGGAERCAFFRAHAARADEQYPFSLLSPDNTRFYLLDNL